MANNPFYTSYVDQHLSTTDSPKFVALEATQGDIKIFQYDGVNSAGITIEVDPYTSPTYPGATFSMVLNGTPTSFLSLPSPGSAIVLTHNTTLDNATTFTFQDGSTYTSVGGTLNDISAQGLITVNTASGGIDLASGSAGMYSYTPIRMGASKTVGFVDLYGTTNALQIRDADGADIYKLLETPGANNTTYTQTYGDPLYSFTSADPGPPSYNVLTTIEHIGTDTKDGSFPAITMQRTTYDTGYIVKSFHIGTSSPPANSNMVLGLMHEIASGVRSVRTYGPLYVYNAPTPSYTSVFATSVDGLEAESTGIIVAPISDTLAQSKVSFLATGATLFTGAGTIAHHPDDGSEVLFTHASYGRTYSGYPQYTKGGLNLTTSTGGTLVPHVIYRQAGGTDIYDHDAYLMDTNATAGVFSSVYNFYIGKPGSTETQLAYSVSGVKQLVYSSTNPNGNTLQIGSTVASQQLDRIRFGTVDNTSFMLMHNTGNASSAYKNITIASGEMMLGFDTVTNVARNLRFSTTGAEFYTVVTGVYPTASLHLSTKSYVDTMDAPLYTFVTDYTPTMQAITLQANLETPTLLDTGVPTPVAGHNMIAYYTSFGKKYIYGNNNNTGKLAIHNVSDPRNINSSSYQLVNGVGANLANFSILAVYGTYLYVTIGTTMYVYSIVTPTAPVYVSQQTAAKTFAYLEVDGTYMYASTTGATSSVYKYDMSIPTAPSLLASVDVTVAGGRITLNSSYTIMYVCYGATGVRVFDISGAGLTNYGGGGVITIYDGANAYEHVACATISGHDYIFISKNNNTIAIYNVDNPASASLVTVYTMGSGTASQNYLFTVLDGSTTYLYCGSATNPELDILDVSTPATPVSVFNTVEPTATVNHMIMRDWVLYLALNGDGIAAYDLGTKLVVGKLLVTSTDADSFKTLGGMQITGDLSIDGTMTDIVRRTSRSPNGFPNTTDTTISFDTVTRTITVTPTGASFRVYVDGLNYDYTTLQTTIIPDVEGMHYGYFNNAGLFTSSQTFPSTSGAIAVALYWNATDSIELAVIDERHGIVMDGSTHTLLHFRFGAVWRSGLAITSITADGDGSLLAHAQVSFNSGVISDEDIVFSVPGSTGQVIAPLECPVAYRVGSLWRTEHIASLNRPSASVPLIIESGNTLPSYNLNTGGVWSLAEMTDGYFINIFLVATSELEHPIYAVLGPAQHATKREACDQMGNEFNEVFNALFMREEFLPLASIMYEINSGYTNIVNARIVTDTAGDAWTDMRSHKESAYEPLHSHHLLTDRTSDDHSQYALLAGRTGDILLIDTINEYTASAGVTIEGVLLRDGMITTTATLSTQEPNGFPSGTDTSMTFTDVSRLFTLSTGSSYDVYIKGTKFTVNTSKTVNIANTSGIHFIYIINSGGTPILETSMSGWGNGSPVAIVYWNAVTAASVMLSDERHGIVMDDATHNYLHSAFGTAYVNGLAMSGFDIRTVPPYGDSNTEAQFTVEQGSIRDEDLSFTLSQFVLAGSAGIPVFYKIGSPGVWRSLTTANYAVYGSATTLYYNQWTGATWQLTNATNGDYVLYHMFATDSYDASRRFIAVMGETSYGNLVTARDAAAVEITTISTAGMPLAEFLPIGTIIYQTNSAYANAVHARVVYVDTGIYYVDFRTSKLSASQIAGTHSMLGGLLNDDHSQYALLAGRTGDILLIDTINEYTSTAGVTIDGLLVKDHSLAYTGSAGNDINITCTGGSINITSTEIATDAIYIRASFGSTLIDSVGRTEIRGSATGNNAIYIRAMTVDGGVYITSGVNRYTTLDGGYTTIVNALGATAVGTGALRVTGGASVGERLYVNSSIRTPALYSLAGSNIITVNDGYLTAHTSFTPLNEYDLVTKKYVDLLASGIRIKPAVQAKSTATLPAFTYVSGTITADVVGALVTATYFDDITLSVGDRVLIDDEHDGSDGRYSGVYNIVSLGGVATYWSMTRANDSDGTPTGEVLSGIVVYIIQGTTYSNQRYAMSATDPITLGVTPMTWSQYSGDTTYTAGTGIDISVGVISVDQTVAFTPTWAGLHSFANASGIATDVIAEYTLNAGVTIEGVLLKDSIISHATSLYLKGTANAVNAVKIEANDGATGGGIDIDALDDGITMDTTGTFTIGATNPPTSLSMTTGGALTLDSTGAGISIDATGASNFTVTGAGTLTLSSTAGIVSLTGANGAATAISVQATGAGSGITMDAVGVGSVLDVNVGSGGITMDSGAGISIDAVATSNFTVTGAGTLTLSSTAGIVSLTGASGGATAVSIQATGAGSGITMDATGTGSVLDVNVGTGGITMDSGAGISIDAVATSNFTVTGAGTLTLSSTAGIVSLTGASGGATAVSIQATGAGSGITMDAVGASSVLDVNVGTGGITIDSGAGISIDAAGTSNFTVTGSGTLNLASTAGSVNIAGASGVATSVSIQATGVGSGIRLDAVATNGALDVNTGTGGITIDTTGILAIGSSVGSSGAIALSTSTASGTITLTSAQTSGGITLQADNATTNGITLQGPLTITSAAWSTPTVSDGDGANNLLSATGTVKASILYKTMAVLFNVSLPCDVTAATMIFKITLSTAVTVTVATDVICWASDGSTFQVVRIEIPTTTASTAINITVRGTFTASSTYSIIGQAILELT